MKYLFAIWILIILGFSDCASTQQRPSEAVKAVHNVIDQLENILTKKYHMQAIGTAVAMPRGIVKELGIDFNIRGPLSKEELRAILVKTTQDFVDYVNADQRIQPFLENHPFGINNVEITLFLIDSSGRSLDHPKIGVAGISRGILFYRTLEYSKMPPARTREEETYEEALKIVQEQAAKKDSITTAIPNS